jgi:hypothetical protein
MERQRIELGDAGIDRVGIARLGTGLGQPVGVLLEVERVLGSQGGPELPPGPGVGKQLDVLLRREPAVAAALGADVERALELLADVDVAAPVARLPGVLRDLEPLALGRPGRFRVTAPARAP